MYRVVRYKPDSHDLLPTPERIYATWEFAMEFVEPLQKAGERGWRIELWDHYKVKYKDKRRGGTSGQVFPTFLKAEEFARKECQGWYEIWEWDFTERAYFQIE